MKSCLHKADHSPEFSVKVRSDRKTQLILFIENPLNHLKEASSWAALEPLPLIFNLPVPFLLVTRRTLPGLTGGGPELCANSFIMSSCDVPGAPVRHHESVRITIYLILLPIADQSS